MVETARSWLESLDLSEPFPVLGLTIAAFIALAMLRNHPIWGVITATAAATGWFVNPVLGMLSTAAATGIAAWALGDNRRRGEQAAATAAFFAVVFIGLLLWAQPEARPDLPNIPGWLLPAVIAVTVTLAGFLLWKIRPRRYRLDPVRFFNEEQRAAVIRRDGNQCNYCGAQGNALGVQLQVDHVVPHSRGGRTSVDNAQMLCGPCNLLKGNLPDSQARRKFKHKHGRPAGSAPHRTFV